MNQVVQVRYSFRGVPTCEDFSNDRSFIRGLMGPFGSGKSSACVNELVERGAAQQPSPDGVRRSRFAVIRNTFPELRDTTIRTVMQWLPPLYCGTYTEHKHSYVIKHLEKTEIELIFLALDRPDDIKKLLSLELTGAWVNEAREVPWAVIEALQGRVGRYPAIRDGGPTWHGIWMDTNPPDADSRWYKFFEESTHKPGFAKLFKQPSGLAPDAENLANLPGGQRYYENLAQGKSAEWIKIYIHGDYGFVAEGKPVYPEYSDTIHCRAVDPIPGVPIIRSYDWGLTPACAFSQMLPDGRWLVFDELVSDNMSADEFGDIVVEHCDRAFKGQVTFEDWADPAGEQRAQTDKRTCFEIFETKGIRVEGSVQNPKMRQESVRKTLRTLVGGEPQFILHPRCKQLRKGFMGGYHRRRLKVSGAERYSESVEKNALSHCFPAGVMVSTPSGQVPIEQLAVGDVVSTPVGPRRVQATMNRVASEIVTVRTTKRDLPCTPNHPIWSGGLFVRADALKYGDVLWSAPQCPQSSTSPKNSTACGFIGSRRDTTKTALAGTCIARFGSITTAPFRSAIISIIETMIAGITRLRISNAYGVRITSRRTPSSGTPTLRSAPKSIWTLSAPSPRNGINPRRAGSVTALLPLRWRRAFQSLITSACDAARPIALNWESGRLAIAPTLASQLLDARAETMMNRGRASSAGAPSLPIATTRPPHADGVVVVSSVQRSEVQVYDLTVEDAHCFFANGILVSNCMEALEYAMVQYFAPSTERANDDDGFFEGLGQNDYAAAQSRSAFTGY